MAKPTAKASRSLKQIDAQSQRFQPRMVKEIQRFGRVEHKRLAEFFAQEKYYPKGTNRLARLAAFGPAWRRRKQLLQLRSQRGQAGGALLKAARSSSSFILTKRGFTISWPRANFFTRGGPGPRGGRYGPTRMNRYFRFYNEQKAKESLGVLAPKQRTRILKAARKETLRRFARTIAAARLLPGGTILIKLKLDKPRFKIG